MNGWIKVYRKLMDKDFYTKDSEKVHLWIHILMQADHPDMDVRFNGKPYFCKYGQFITDRKQLSKETGIDEYKIERILTYFEQTAQQIAQQKTNINRLISILKWDIYQQTAQQSAQQIAQQNDDKITAEEQSPKPKKSKKKEDEQTSEPNPAPDWRKDFNLYLTLLKLNYDSIIKDPEWIKEQEKYYPNIDIILSLERGINSFWGKEAGWMHKKKSKTSVIDWRATFSNAINFSKVYKTNKNGYETYTNIDGRKLTTAEITALRNTEDLSRRIAESEGARDERFY